MKIEQFVMAYRVEQDRLRAMLPEGFISLKPCAPHQYRDPHRETENCVFGIEYTCRRLWQTWLAEYRSLGQPFL